MALNSLLLGAECTFILRLIERVHKVLPLSLVPFLSSSVAHLFPSSAVKSSLHKILFQQHIINGENNCEKMPEKCNYFTAIDHRIVVDSRLNVAAAATKVYVISFCHF